MTTALIVALVVILIAAVLVYRAMRTVPEASADVVERFGRYHRTLRSGTNVVIPFIDAVRNRVDLREQVVSFPPQPVTTSDNLTVSIETVVYFRVEDPKAATYKVSNYISAIEQHTVTTMRNVIGDMNLDTAINSRSEINTKLRRSLTEIADGWGLEINRVEVKAMDPPPSIQDSLEKQKQADRDTQAGVSEAEGRKQAQILDAEGERQSAVLRARGEAEAAVLKAKAEAQAEAARARGQAEAIGILAKAIADADPDQRLLAYQYMQILPRLAEGAADKMWVVPGDLGRTMEGIGGLSAADAASRGPSSPPQRATPPRPARTDMPPHQGTADETTSDPEDSATYGYFDRPA